MKTTIQYYTTRSGVENFLNRSFTEITTAQFDAFIMQAETYIDNFLGYTAEGNTKGLIQEVITRERHMGKVDEFGNMTIELYKPPIAFDSNGNPNVTDITYHVGQVRVPLTLTDGTTNAFNSVIEVSENRRKIYYPSIYFLPAISTVTPSAKVNLYALSSVKFWVDVSYTGGYVGVPADIQMAAAYLVSDIVLHRDNPLFLQSFSQGSVSQTYGGKTRERGRKLPEGMQMANAILNPYVRVTY